MEIVASALEWTSVDTDNLSKFLDTPTGRRLLPKLADVTPELLSDGEVNKILIRTGEVRGFQAIMREILFLAHPPPPAPSDGRAEEYPDLTNDAKWEGQKLKDPNPQIL